MAAEIVVFVWDSTYAASGVLADLRRHHGDEEWVDHLAVVERHRSGRVATHTTHGSVVEGAAWGVVVGGLVGLLFGPAGVLWGAAAAGAAGAALEDVVKETGLSENLLADVRDSLDRQSSALVLMGPEDQVTDALTTVGRFEPDRVIREPVSDETVRHIESGVER